MVYTRMLYELPEFVRLKTQQALREFNSLFPEHITDFQRVCMVYQMMTREILYEEGKSLSHNWNGLLKRRAGVCQAISDLFVILVGTVTRCDVRTVPGYTTASLDKAAQMDFMHAWNVITFPDNKTFFLDVTWDLGAEPSDYQYFLVPESNDRLWAKDLYPKVENHGYRDQIYENEDLLKRLCEFYRELAPRFAAGMYRLPPG